MFGKNIGHFRPGPIAEIRQILNLLSVFQLFISDDMLNRIVLYTNQQINKANENYKVAKQTFSDNDLIELSSFRNLYTCCGYER